MMILTFKHFHVNSLIDFFNTNIFFFEIPNGAIKLWMTRQLFKAILGKKKLM